MAIVVMVVSRQLDSVRVEQNHCHGLHTDRANYMTQIPISEIDTGEIAGARTYSSEGSTTATTVGLLRELPCEAVEQGCKDGLGNLGGC
jgi:hypothetical protein